LRLRGKAPSLYHTLGATIALLLARFAGTRGHFSTPFLALGRTRAICLPLGKTSMRFTETQRSEAR
jgi:hypothetical protein